MNKSCAVVGVAWIVALWGEPSLAQVQFQPRLQSEDLFLMAPRSLQRLLAEGRTSIREGRFADGVAALGAILQDDSESVAEDLHGQDFFSSRPARGSYTQSLKNEAIAELSLLPPEGRRILELQFGVKARQLLDAAMAARDLDAIEAVARRFVHTQAGYDAMVLVAQSKLNHGYPLAAADILQTLLDYPAARQQYGVQLAYYAALSWQQADKPARAASTLELARRDFPEESLTIGGRQYPLEDVEGILRAAGSSSGDGTVDNTASAWLTAGGSAARNATAVIGLPLPNERWEWFIHGSRPEGQALRRVEETLRKSGSVLLPKLELRTLDNTVISRSNDSTIVGLDFDTGMLIWRRPSSSGVAPLKRGAWEGGDQSLSDELLNRIWGSTSFGRISCDTQRCYHVVHSQEEVEALRGTMSIASSRLEGISIARQGAIQWSIGGNDGDEPQLATAFFLGPPLPYGGQLYSLVEINGETELVVLDPESGRLRWRQKLASAAQLPISLDRGRQSQALTPSIADGVIVCPTGVGGVVAIDLLTRSLRWGATYVTRGTTSGFSSPLLAQEYDPLQSRWLDDGLIIDNGIVVFTPPESDSLYCYDLLSGELLYSRKRGQACYVAGIDGSNLILVGPQQVLAYDIRRKENRWETRFPDGLALVGKGVWQAGQLLLPLTDQRLIQIELAHGKLVSQATVAQPLGNLFAHRGHLLSIGPTSITAYYTRSQLEQQVQERLAQNPQDTWGLNYRSQLLLAEGQVMAALQLLLEAYAANPHDDDTRYFLADAMLAGLQADFERFAGYTDQLDDVVQSTPQRLRYLQLLAQGKERQGDYLGAFRRLWEIMQEQQAAFVAGAQSRAGKVQMSPRHAVDLDAWFTAEMGRCYSRCTDDQRQEIQQLVAAEAARVRGTVLPVRRQVMRYLSQVPAADQENLELATALLQRGEQTQAEQVLTWLGMSADAHSRAAARQLLGQPNALDQLLADPLGEGSTVTAWRNGLIEAVVDAGDDAIYSVGRPLEVAGQRYGRPPIAIAVSDRALALTDVNGKPIHNLQYRPATSDLSGTFMNAEVRGGLILLETVSELVAFDFYRGSDRNSTQTLLWRHSLDTAAPQETFQPAQMFLSTDEPLGIQIPRRKTDNRKYTAVGPLLAQVKIIQSGGSIIGLDPYTGRQLWSRDGYNDQLRLAGRADSHELAVVNPPAGTIELIDGRDGKLIRESRYLVEEMQQRLQDNRLHRWNHWLSTGDWLVDYRSDAEHAEVMLRVWNPREEQVLLEMPLPKEARVATCDRQLLAALDPAGRLILVDFEQQQWHEYQVPVDQDLASVQVLRFADHIVVVGNRIANPQRPLLAHGEIPANGYLYAIGAHDKELSWTTPGVLQGMTIPLMQPRNSPYLIACRFESQQEQPLAVTIALVDLRDGRLSQLVERLSVQGARSISMRLRPELQQVALAVGERNLRLQITDQPPPPEPVVRFGGSADSATAGTR